MARTTAHRRQHLRGLPRRGGLHRHQPALGSPRPIAPDTKPIDSHFGVRGQVQPFYPQCALPLPTPPSCRTADENLFIQNQPEYALNRALHVIVLSRIQHHVETKAYVQRRIAEGKSYREIRRCLKRFVARRLFKLLESTAMAT